VVVDLYIFIGGRLLKHFALLYIRRTKNADFSFDNTLSSMDLASFVMRKIIEGARGALKLGVRRRSFIGAGVSIRHKRHLSHGSNLVIGNHVRINALGSGGASFGNNVNIGSFSQVIVTAGLSNLGSHITIGSNVGIGEFSYIGGGGGVTIGDDVIIGQYFSVHPENHIFGIRDLPIRLSGTSRQGVVIGRNCWIGSKVTILDGVHIGDNCVIAAGAVVARSVGPNNLIGGVPARVIKNIAPDYVSGQAARPDATC
jgi:acetyltransferase-like isoleucine patch superfamily enzyme